jgi:aminopeptidase N
MLAVFEDLCGIKYPYTKYDVIFSADLIPNYCAMENPGIVNFEERLMDPNSFKMFNYSSYLMVHEMAHMWYGNICHIEDWGECWLKETFADYSAFLTLPIY